MFIHVSRTTIKRPVECGLWGGRFSLGPVCMITGRYWYPPPWFARILQMVSTLLPACQTTPDGCLGSLEPGEVTVLV